MSGVNRRREEEDRRGAAAKAEINRRLGLATDRLMVAMSSDGGIPAQFLHAIHYLERGWADDSRIVPKEAPDVQFTHGEAEKLALALHSMLVAAKNTRSTAGDAE